MSPRDVVLTVFVVLVLAVLVVLSLRIIKEYERGVAFRLGPTPLIVAAAIL